MYFIIKIFNEKTYPYGKYRTSKHPYLLKRYENYESKKHRSDRFRVIGIVSKELRKKYRIPKRINEWQIEVLRYLGEVKGVKIYYEWGKRRAKIA
jgi:hypothetical protein